MFSLKMNGIHIVTFYGFWMLTALHFVYFHYGSWIAACRSISYFSSCVSTHRIVANCTYAAARWNPILYEYTEDKYTPLAKMRNATLDDVFWTNTSNQNVMLHLDQHTLVLFVFIFIGLSLGLKIIGVGCVSKEKSSGK
ncbi:unnamed protein product [Orchesella dallaii]|uniref:Uncharacterized protein n=1 Tax=Orchesella dallaii TaxID=48710 RepID=A0ABP1QMT3_9HEXA